MGRYNIHLSRQKKEKNKNNKPAIQHLLPRPSEKMAAQKMYLDFAAFLRKEGKDPDLMSVDQQILELDAYLGGKEKTAVQKSVITKIIWEKSTERSDRERTDADRALIDKDAVTLDVEIVPWGDRAMIHIDRDLAILPPNLADSSNYHGRSDLGSGSGTKILCAQMSSDATGRRPMQWSGENGFIAALHHAYANHHYLKMGPDDIWLLILGGLQTHMNIPDHAERYREMWVGHQGKINLEVRDDRLSGDHASPAQKKFWVQTIGAFEGKLSKHVHSRVMYPIMQGFSTSTALTRMTCQVAVMACTKEFFTFSVNTLCGVRGVLLEGTLEDWNSLKERAKDLLEIFGLNWWWKDALEPALNEFIKALGSKNLYAKFWKQLYKYIGASGGPYMNGSFNTFFPYIGRGGHVRQNPYLSTWRGMEPRGRPNSNGGNNADDYPINQGLVPVTWKVNHQETPLTLKSGFGRPTYYPELDVVFPEMGYELVVAEE